MTVNSRQLRSERHAEIGSLICRDRGLVIERWRKRALDEQPHAQRVHLDVLLDHFEGFLWALGNSLAEPHDLETGKHRLSAREHGEQRWENGWSLTELVRDYQLLRIVLLEYLDETLERPLRCREVMAVGLALDEAIAASVARYVSNREEHIRQIDRKYAEQDKRREETRLQREAEALQEEIRRKDEFLATLGHELRNPLAPIRNAVHVLRLREPDTQTLQWAKAVVDRQVRHMTGLVDELLDVTRINRGKIQLHRGPLDLREMIQTVAADCTGLAEARLTLDLHLPPQPVLLLGDALRLTQVLANLLNNAVKFTDPGGRVTITLSADAMEGRALVTVQDTGIGIEPEVLPHIFETFSQSKRSIDRSRGGLGLGLALVKGLVELHGGKVQAASAGSGQGSTFAFWLPIEQAVPAPPKPAPENPPNTKSLRILLIDDNRDATDSLRMILSAAGHDVAVAYSGAVGLQTAEHFKPDIILCDLLMPDMDGYTVSQALNQNRATARTRLIALSGYGTEADTQRCLEAGFERLLTKPVEPEELLRMLTAM